MKLKHATNGHATKSAPLAPDNAERGVMLKRESNTAELQTIIETFEKFDALCKGIESGAIKSVNLGRELGLHLQTLCGHQQMKLSFWQGHCEKQLPFDFKAASLFISIANKIEQPVKTLAEAVPMMQTVLQADGVLILSERTDLQKASGISVLQKFFAEVTLIRADFKKAMMQKPREHWTRDDKDSFLSTTEWIDEARAWAKL